VAGFGCVTGCTGSFLMVFYSMICASSKKEDLLDSNWQITSNQLLFLRIDKLVKGPRAGLKTGIKHSNSLFKVKRAGYSNKVNTPGEFINGNEKDNFSGTTNEEVAGTQFAFPSYWICGNR
jgi:hypothetical protein